LLVADVVVVVRDDGDFIHILLVRFTLTCCFFLFGAALTVIGAFFLVAMTLVALVVFELSLEFDLVVRRLGGSSLKSDKSIFLVVDLS